MTDMQRFTDKVAVVTGAAGGFGEAIARRFADEGASVVVADVDESGAERLAKAIRDGGGEALAARTDVSLAEDVERMIGVAIDRYGGLDILVNNAGVAHRGMMLWELPEEEYDRVFDTNTKGVYLGVKYAVPALRDRGGGAIVNTASIGAVSPRPMLTAYNATKGAVITMTRGLAVELAQFKIRVNAVNPVAADTAFMTGVYGKEMSDRAREALIANIPLGRLTEPRDVASAVLFLASDEAEFLTGVCLNVDGGRSIS